MTIRNYNLMPSTVGKLIGVLGPTVTMPIGDPDSIAKAQAVTLGVAMTLNGDGVVNGAGGTTTCLMPFPYALVFTCNAAADTFTVDITGLDQFGRPETRVMSKTQVATVSQRDTAGVGWSRIDSIIFSAYASAGNIQVGSVLPVAADSGQNSLVRIPLPIALVENTDVMGFYVENDGGTDAAFLITGNVIKTGATGYSVLSVPGGSSYATVLSFAATVTATQPVTCPRLRMILNPAKVNRYY